MSRPATALIVERPGPLATVQDLGRPGFRAFGVPIGGAFDLDSHELANALVGNEPDAATIELTLVGGTFRAFLPMALALAGAPMPVRILRGGVEAGPLLPPVAFAVVPEDRLVIGPAPIGARAYLAVRGGWRTDRTLGSRSSEEPLRPGDALPAFPGTTTARRPAADLVRPIGVDEPIALIDGPDARLLADRDWTRHEYRVAPESDRMGLRLEGPEVAVASAGDRDSAPVAPGAVQVAGGRPIVLGVASGTMGGYPYVGHVATADLSRIAQLRPGDPVRFRWVTVAEARRLDRLDRDRRRAVRLRIAAAAGEGPGIRGEKRDEDERGSGGCPRS